MNVPVIIIGGGPVGMTLALALAQRGIRTVLFNTREDTTTHPRLDVVNPRSMEMFRRMGIADAVRAVGNPVHQHQNIIATERLVDEPVWSFGDESLLLGSTLRCREIIAENHRSGRYPLEPMHRVAQMRLEPVLKQQIDAQPLCDVRFGWEVHDIEEDANGVTVHAECLRSGEQSTVKGQYLIGCDGPDSITRRWLGINYHGMRDLVGELFIIHFRSQKLRELFPGKVPPWHAWSVRRQLKGLIVCPNGGEDYVMHKAVPVTSKEELQVVLRGFIGSDDVDLDIVQTSAWRPQFLVAESYGRGRVWLAGDACHQFMPTGGMGMNSGIAEAYNLAWKLAAVLKGWGGPQLVSSYNAERQPTAVSAREHVRRGGAVAAADLAPDGIRDEAERQRVRERAARLERLYTGWGAEFGYSYANARDGDSPIVEANGEALPYYDDIEYRPSARAGSRLPSLLREDGTAIFDRLHREGYTLLNLARKSEGVQGLKHAAKERGVPFGVERITEDYARDVYAADYVLVRPDEHVAWRGNSIPKDPLALIDRIRGASNG